MSKELFQYDPLAVSVTIGTIILDGYIEGEFVTIARDQERHTKTVGGDGSTIRNKRHNNNARVTVRVMDSSPVNAQLEALAASGAIVAFAMTDNNGTDKWSASLAWMVSPADDAKGVEAGQNEWMVDLHQAKLVRGGLTEVTLS